MHTIYTYIGRCMKDITHNKPNLTFFGHKLKTSIAKRKQFDTLNCAENTISMNNSVDTTNMDVTRGSSILHNFS